MNLILLIIIPVFLLSFFLAGGISSPFPTRVVVPSGEPRAVIANASPEAGKQLQINTLKFASPTPRPSTPPSTCTSDTGTTCDSPSNCSLYYVTCNGNSCSNVVNGPAVNDPRSHGSLNCAAIDQMPYDCNGDRIAEGNGWCNAPCLNPGGGNFTTCMAKPVIYLYPLVDTLVDVKLILPGRVTVSIPTYEEGGWQDVLAHPGGNLEYRGKSYKELFYESEVDHVNPPINGIIIPKNQLHAQLGTYMLRLGLNEREQKEFLDYWVPSLLEQPGNYILFSILGPTEKERLDKIHISPEPETRIELLAYFKPLEFPIVVTPLILPEKPPERKGFTMVEWGGTIDK